MGRLDYATEFAPVCVGEVETHDFCLDVIPKPHRKQQALHLPSQFPSRLRSMTSNQPKDSSLKPMSSLNKVARLQSPIPRSANDSTARSSSRPPTMTPSSAIRAADAGTAVVGEMPDNPFVHQFNINPHLIKHCRQPGGIPLT